MKNLCDVIYGWPLSTAWRWQATKWAPGDVLPGPPPSSLGQPPLPLSLQCSERAREAKVKSKKTPRKEKKYRAQLKGGPPVW